MAATISINFANEQDVYDESQETLTLRTKKSVSAKLLQDVLGGGVVSGGYVQRTGSSMTGFLTLTSLPPTDPYHAAPKSYVDSRAYARRYFYECKIPVTGSGIVAPNSTVLSGRDINDNHLYFFEKGDTMSLANISRYMDVYRDGILQSFGSDYSIINTFGNTVFSGITAIRFNEPFENGTTFQVTIGNVGAFPATFGVQGLSAGNGLNAIPYGGYTATGAVSGNVNVYIEPSEIIASSETVRLSSEINQFLTPRYLSAYPLIPRAFGLFRKLMDPEWNDIEGGTEKTATQPYGSSDGLFIPIDTKKVVSIQSDPNGESAPIRFRVVLENGMMTDTNYNAVVSINSRNFNTEEVVFATVNSNTKELTSFDFFVYDALGSAPIDVYEISTMVY